MVFEQEWLTYSELHKRSNQIAHFLKEQGIGLGDKVGLLAKGELTQLLIC